MVTDSALRVQFANPYVSSWSGWSRDELLQSKLEEFCPALASRVREGQTSGEVSCGFCDLECHLGFRVFPLRGLPPHADGGFIISFTDLSRIMELRRSLRLKERLTAMGEVIAKVAHEIRNPLFAVSGAAQLLSKELVVGAGHRKLIDSILVQTRRMNNVVQHLLEFTSEPRLRSVNFDLVSAVAEAADTCSSCFSERNVTALVAPSEPVWLWGDRRQIIQALENLLRNAAEASAAGETVDVEILERQDAMVTVSVCDRGEGVPEPDMERIFELFYTSKRGGVGLGLPISRKIMEAHGGELEAAPRAGGGICFTVTLPKDGADA
jgi:signal transduction histidine kinase